jgi:hypothetical protein
MKQNEVFSMLAAKFNPDPSDIRSDTIQKLFYRQVRSMTMKSSNDRMRTFDLQFSDAWF